MPKIEKFLSQIASVAANADTDYADVGEYRSRVVAATLFPKSMDQVVEIVRKANENLVPLYPVSQGKNWGFGSSLPVRTDCVVLSLSLMSEIHELDPAGHVVIDPGVTQGQLAKHLADGPWMLNVTAAGSQTSIIGNGLENGLGFWRPRVEDLLELEFISGAGDRRRAMDGHGNSRDISIAQLIQSSLGIVISGKVALIRRPSSLLLVRLRFDATQFPNVMETMNHLHQSGSLTGVSKVWKKGERSEAHGLIAGDEKHCKHQREQCEKALKHLGHCEIRNGDEADLEPAAKSSIDLYNGIPNDFVIRSFFQTWDPEINPDALSKTGVKIISVSVENTTEQLSRVNVLIETTNEKCSCEILGTFNVFGAARLVLVLYVRFDRSPEQIAEATRVHSELMNGIRLLYGGFRRLDIDHQHYGSTFRSSERNSEMAALKKDLDPNGIIAPGRYGPSM